MLTKLRRPARRTTTRQFDAGVVDLGTGECHSVGLSQDLKSPSHAQAALRGQEPCSNRQLGHRLSPDEVRNRSAHHGHAAIEFEAAFDGQAERSGMMPRDAIAPGYVNGIVDMLIRIDVARVDLNVETMWTWQVEASLQCHGLC